MAFLFCRLKKSQFDNDFYICYNRKCPSQKMDKKKKFRRIIVKNILNGILPLFIAILLFIIGFDNVSANEIIKKGENLEVYQIKSKEEVLVENIKVLDFYNNNYDTQILKEHEEKQEEVDNIIFKNNIVNFALQFVGNPYVMGGTSLTNGADCSGFVQSVFANFDILLPRTTYEQSVIGIGINIDEIEIGDIVSYGYEGYSTHSALYIGDGMILHASIPELGIRVDNMHIMPIVAIRRVI